MPVEWRSVKNNADALIFHRIYATSCSEKEIIWDRFRLKKMQAELKACA
jgi:hypothetical protein